MSELYKNTKSHLLLSEPHYQVVDADNQAVKHEGATGISADEDGRDNPEGAIHPEEIRECGEAVDNKNYCRLRREIWVDVREIHRVVASGWDWGTGLVGRSDNSPG